MDATPSNALALSDADAYSDLLAKSGNPEFPFPLQQKNTVIKYTKLPEFDLDSKGLWPRQSYTVQPRSRRFITFQEPITVTNKTMSAEVELPNNKTAGNLSSRKIVTIVEDDEHDLKPRFSTVGRFCSVQKVSRASTAKLITPKFDVKDSIHARNKNTSFSHISSRYFRESKPSAKISNTLEAKDPKPKFNNRRKPPNISTENNKPKTVRRKDIPSTKSSRSNIFKNTVPQTNTEKETSLIKSKLNDNETSKKPRMTLVKKPREKVNLSKLIKPDHKTRNPVLSPKDFSFRNTDVIHVPLEDVSKTKTLTPPSSYVTPKCLSTTELIIQMDKNISTDSPELKVNSSTTLEPEPCVIYKYLQSTGVQTELVKKTFDNLDIPNVTLTKTESDVESRSKSLTNIPFNAFGSAEDVHAEPNLESSSYIISRATLTYTTEQKFDLQVVGSNDDAFSNHAPSPLSYPINVVSVYKKEMQGEDCETKVAKSIDGNRKHSKHYKSRINNIKTLDYCYAPMGNRLIKPSDIISTIRVNNGTMQSDYICDQFQRELNFIDSFFESLIYLESVLTKKYVAGDNIDERQRDLVESSNSFGYENFISNFRNDSIADESQTMASKNLFLLNILIRDEQRRAKNLLFVLKRREDALKNFTKSQILYLENKKKQDNTDISALKKKQRGALLKLQHECGEMQRMRRALLTLSDKRKLTLMKTKKDLELKLKNNVDVDTIILGKKLVKRSACADRASPLKCFDLTSSSCEDSSTSRRHSIEQISPEPVIAKLTVSAEKSIQTGDTTLVDESTNTADENFIIVDGGYLNILFHNLSLPRIFSGGKQYEVNEPALKNIVESCNSQQALNNSKTVQVHTLIDNLKNRESDASSTPSTARSLLDEFDQYYKVLHRKYDSISSEESDFKISVCELKDAVVQAESSEIFEQQTESKSTDTLINSDLKIDKVTTEENILINKPCECEVIANESMESIKVFEPCACEEFEDAERTEVFVISPTGPLPVPAGEASADASTDVPSWHPVCSSVTTSTSNTFLNNTKESLEAEELRKQQLAIEKEIKELEQQQCMVVREIPDKPPPPYTPPAPPRQFKLDDVTKTTISMYMNMELEDYSELKEPFDAFVQDFCNEALEKTRQELSDLPWDACNLAPPKPPLDREKLADVTAADLNQVLAGAKPTVICGISTRRSDHIDDVLFTEWQRVEPEWTSLHKDEVAIKNLVFESIFQRILTDTVDEYKRTVLCDQPASN